MWFTGQMKTALPFRLFGRVSIAASFVLAAFGVVHAETSAGRPPEKADLPHVAAPPRLAIQNHGGAAAALLKKLAEAPTDEGAELIASALEKLWRQSGSDTADLLLERAGVAFQSQDYDLAAKLLGSLTSVAPTFAEGWNQLATVHFLREDYDNAMRELQQALALEPQNFKAIEGMAIILRETGHKRAALRAMRQALAIYPRLKSAIQAEQELAREVHGQAL